MHQEFYQHRLGNTVNYPCTFFLKKDNNANLNCKNLGIIQFKKIQYSLRHEGHFSKLEKLISSFLYHDHLKQLMLFHYINHEHTMKSQDMLRISACIILKF